MTSPVRPRSWIGWREGAALGGGLALLIAPFLSWRDFRDGGAAAGLPGISSLYGREVLVGAVACCLLLLARTRWRSPKVLTVATAAVALLALVPLLLYAAETDQLASVAVVASPGLRITAGVGPAVGLAGDAVLLGMGVVSGRRPRRPLDQPLRPAK